MSDLNRIDALETTFESLQLDRLHDIGLIKETRDKMADLGNLMALHLMDGDDLHPDFYRDVQALWAAIDNCRQSLRASEVGRDGG